jgi:hypothetical protein
LFSFCSTGAAATVATKTAARMTATLKRIILRVARRELVGLEGCCFVTLTRSLR